MGLKRFVLAASLCVTACDKAPPPPSPPPQAEIKPDLLPAPEKAPPAPAPAKAAEPEPDEGPDVWVVHSGDGAATLRQKQTAPGTCYLSCTTGDGKEAWKSNGACMAEKAERKFMSKDCQRTLVFIPSPPRGKNWRQQVVMRVYKKEKLDYPVMGIAALPDERLMKGSTSWLRGCYGADGEPPRYSSDGDAVEYDTIDGKSHSVPLAGK